MSTSANVLANPAQTVQAGRRLGFGVAAPAPLAAAAPAPAAESSTEAPAPKTPAMFWLNIGREVEMQFDDGQGGIVMEKVFVSLPVGVPLDTMREVTINGRTENWSAQQAAKNALLRKVMGEAQGFKGGEARLTTLQVQLRRVKTEADATVAAPGENPLIQDFDLF